MWRVSKKRPLYLIINIISIVMGQGISGAVGDDKIVTTGNPDRIEKSLI